MICIAVAALFGNRERDFISTLLHSSGSYHELIFLSTFHEFFVHMMVNYFKMQPSWSMIFHSPRLSLSSGGKPIPSHTVQETLFTSQFNNNFFKSRYLGHEIFFYNPRAFLFWRAFHGALVNTPLQFTAKFVVCVMGFCNARISDCLKFRCSSSRTTFGSKEHWKLFTASLFFHEEGTYNLPKPLLWRR